MATIRALIVLHVLVALSFVETSGQFHYVPAQIRIPALNASTVLVLHNSTANDKPVDNTGWNNPLLNKTRSWNWNQTTPNGDLIVGKIRYMDHRLFNQLYWESGRWWASREKLVAYPQQLPGSYGRHETISAIRVFNQHMDGGASKAEVVSGGVGKRFAKIKLSSNFGKGFKYLVQIYGH